MISKNIGGGSKAMRAFQAEDSVIRTELATVVHDDAATDTQRRTDTPSGVV